MGCTACTEPQCLYKDVLYTFPLLQSSHLSLVVIIQLCFSVSANKHYNFQSKKRYNYYGLANVPSIILTIITVLHKHKKK
jgi:hypothetical protein